ncbi:hypothetical protein DSM03_102387 [Leeuwenhoekiella aestuarii]|uniref:Spermatogenesis-associated protein 20-like TRX domain-containing protein n=1 Tax=Leeuwenhoekiella aestuarii TaxID=2249426 RepID=A0A4V1KPF6_9FLAO|nr:thioredoxin domain-containing protein [Leeuwenhoekiella aestuarii]RXG15383.1 hypothetical protein DSM04_103271 [Leeuwenhoekiella aestuarii]RXG17510.1 hypothetical protein DSM03_102387 [Leeuwenhoekiella aestuarii]
MYKQSALYFVTQLIWVYTLLVPVVSFSQEPTSDFKHTNALINETSPYLLQHAHNPVNWQPWSEAAFEQAKSKNKLVIVSIGYSSCHWCHVMEEETFSQEDVAQVMNKNFINIKVDREERPDVDQVYMTAVQLIQGSGGWPLNVIVLPNGRPLYGGTYHTKADWIKLLNSLSKTYKEQPEKATEFANRLAAGIQEKNDLGIKNEPVFFSKKLLNETINTLKENWDLKYGGLKGQQKFMLPANLNFLLDYVTLSNDAQAKEYTNLSLDNIALRGVYDHVDGGFFRYSIDEKWQLPHFEKMLYDNAQLLSVYANAYKVFKKPLYKERIEETYKFLSTIFKSKSGAYIAALDADVNGEEGAYYLWKLEELEAIITDRFELFKAYYNIFESNVVESESYHLFATETNSEFCENQNISEAELINLKIQWKTNLQQWRHQRQLPRKDDKIIISWNALLISGLVDAYEALGDAKYLNEAQKIYTTLLKNAYITQNLMHSYKKNSKPDDGFLDDYVFMTKASFDLYSATTELKYLDQATKFLNQTKEKFSDNESVFYKFNSGEKLISKIITTNDGVQPSANSIMAQNLLKLGHFYYNEGYLNESKKMLTAIHEKVTSFPGNYSQWFTLQLNMTYPYYEIAVVGKDTPTLLSEFNTMHLPNTILVGSSKTQNQELFESRFVAGETYIYVCEEKACKLPVKTVNEAINQMETENY